MRGGTEKQLKLIEEMELFLGVEYVGNSITEASHFISAHMENYQAARELAYEEVYYGDVF